MSPDSIVLHCRGYELWKTKNVLNCKKVKRLNCTLKLLDRYSIYELFHFTNNDLEDKYKQSLEIY